jgi:hypothetical protein
MMDGCKTRAFAGVSGFEWAGQNYDTLMESPLYLNRIHESQYH